MSKEKIKFQYDTHYYEGEKISFNKQGLKVAGLLFYPLNFDKNKKYPAIVVTHPGGGVKEQCSSLYAWNLSQRGYVALAYDASHQGESEGEPRFLEDPASRMEDIRSAVDYLITLSFVNEEKIGALGICAGAGYTMSATQTNIRIKATAGVSTWNPGHGVHFGNPGSYDENTLESALKAVAAQRNKEARGEKPLYIGYIPSNEEELSNEYYAGSTIMKEAYEYYRTPRCQYPTSENKLLFTSLDKLLGYDAFLYLDCVAPRALCFIIGERADTQYFSRNAFDKAHAPKELHIIKGASHIDLYDKPEFTSQAIEKLNDFFNKHLQKGQK